MANKLHVTPGKAGLDEAEANALIADAALLYTTDGTGQAKLWYDATTPKLLLATVDNGITVYSGGGTAAHLILEDADGETAYIRKVGTGALEMLNEETDGDFAIGHTGTAAGVTAFLQAVPDGNTTLLADDSYATTAIIIDPVAEDIEFISGDTSRGTINSAGWICAGTLAHTGTKVGFYGTNGIVQPTGVAANSAAIITALKSLGLFGT